MYSLPEQIISANRASVETLTSIANVTFSGVERVMALNVNTVRGFLDVGGSTSRSWLAAKDLRDVIAIQSSVAKPDFDKVGAYARRVFDIATQTQGTMVQMAEARVSDINSRLDQELNKLARKAPPGADLAVDALRSAVSAANSAYRDMRKAARKFAELAEANLAVAAAATRFRKAA